MEPKMAQPLPGTMPDRLPEGARAPAGFDPVALAKTLLRATRAGTLGTLDRNTGHPFGSLVNIATDADASPLILTSRLSAHTANLEADGRAAVLLAETGKGGALAHPRLTVPGTFARIEHGHARVARTRRPVPRRPAQDGVDLTAGDRTARLAFPQPVTSAAALRQILVELAQQARAI